MCPQVCNNTIGSYFCTCYRGYMLESDNVTCAGTYTSHSHINLQTLEPSNHLCVQILMSVRIWLLGATRSVRTLLGPTLAVVEMAMSLTQMEERAKVWETDDSIYIGVTVSFPPLDIDECALMYDRCNQNCTNTPGSYTCSCYDGSRLDPDLETCQGKFSLREVWLDTSIYVPHAFCTRYQRVLGTTRHLSAILCQYCGFLQLRLYWRLYCH